ncbi:PI-PLC X domain-containing protein 3 [Halotydeus destructor]|nr:PI-PLC X domain-containing protein 3 [Halotydeus destructor]
MVWFASTLAYKLRQHSFSIVFAATFSPFGKSRSDASNAVDWSDLSHEDIYRDSLCDWMSRLPENLQKVPLCHLTLPGSHDSGSYALETKSGMSPDKPELRRWWMRAFGFVAYPIVKKWTITQTCSLQEQLENGIRYFDFRAAPKPNEVDLFFVHGLYGPKCTDMCREINDFLDKNPKEVVVIHVQHFIVAGAEQQLHLLLDMIRIFKDKVCPFDNNHLNITLEQMWKSKYQVFIFYPKESPVKSNFLWPASYIPNPWANTTSTDFLSRFLTERLDQRMSDRFFVTQGVLTPDDEFVKRHLFSSLYRRLVIPCNLTLDKWLDDKRAGPLGPNVVMSDFVEWNNFKIPRKVVGLNYKTD